VISIEGCFAAVILTAFIMGTLGLLVGALCAAAKGGKV
jgi:hypothetical protein